MSIVPPRRPTLGRHRRDNLPRPSPEEFQKSLAKMRVSPAVDYVIQQLEGKLKEHKMPPGQIFVNSVVWLSTGTWQMHVDNWYLNAIEVTLELIWTSQPGQRETNPNAPQVDCPPAGFGPAFVLPHKVKWQLELTETPTNAGGWVTDVAPGIDAEHLEYFKELFLGNIEKLGYFELV
jgi:hypothetical protein